MSLQHPSLPDMGLQDLVFVLAWLLALTVLVPTQLASMILFDSTGLDVYAPDLVFMVAVPALALTLPPALVARRFYARRTVSAIAAVAFATFALVAAYTMGFYGMCGPDC